ncbi:MAG: GAF domain-containing protein [Acidobacteriota bacterium]|nr:MAG: GAF domain-containing protein [Acidobacteriota bacterium]
MNSEELELSLRTEFENYLKGVLNEMKQEAREFQSKIEAEFDKHRAQIDEAFAAFSARMDSESHFDEAFIGSVSEHLRLARDEGAKITATAFAEAEKLQEETASAVSFENLRDAIADISTKDSQSSILKALIDHVAQFAPRGAFFIVKNEHFVGWKVFGADADSAEESVREIHFPIVADSVLGEAIRQGTTVDSAAGAHPSDAAFLDPLEYGRPDRMYAIPLVAKGKGVAVLYADYGQEGAFLNREALETLVRIAGMTVELIAAGTAVQRAYDPQADLDTSPHEDQPQYTDVETHEAGPAAETGSEYSGFDRPSQVETVYEEPAPEPAAATSYSEEPAYTEQAGESPFGEAQVETPFTTASEQEQEKEPAYSAQPFEDTTTASTEFDSYQFESGAEESSNEGAPSTEGAIVYDAPVPFEPSAPIGSPFEAPAHEYVPEPEPQPEPAVVHDAAPAYQPMGEPAVETVAPGVSSVPRSRLSDRNVDLPIEVPEEERRLHNDARRFARLLVSEIKLYNEKKVLEGRDANDLYDRLKEAIDRSREMYDKRVQPPVAAKFDYFHYELVNALADGDQGRLGASYPGGR